MIEQLDTLLQAIVSAATPSGVLIVLAGVAAGILVGALPGLGPTVGIAVALPIVIRFPPVSSIWLLMGIIIGASFGNSLTAIVLGIPGSASAVLSTIESRAFRKSGQELRAVTTALTASFVGQVIAVVVFIVAVLPLARFALGFLMPEVFALTLFALCTVVGLSKGNLLKGLVAVAVGFALATIGPDPITGQIRYGFGIPELYTGLPQVAAIIGLLAFREVFDAAGRKGFFIGDAKFEGKAGLRVPSLKEMLGIREQMGSTLVGTGIGSVIGAMPGSGPAVATFLTYGALQGNRKIRKELGNGSLKAIAGIDAAQNAASTTALIPTLALGIPGSAPMVIIMALLTARGIFVGPALTQTHPDIIQAVFAGLLIACPLLLIVGYFTLGPAVYIAKLSHPGVVSGSIVLMIVGVYSLRWSLTDVAIALAVGIVGYLMSSNGYPIAPAALAMILAPILETNLRRGLLMARGDLIEFVSRPITATLLVMSVLLLGASRLGGNAPDLADAEATDEADAEATDEDEDSSPPPSAV